MASKNQDDGNPSQNVLAAKILKGQNKSQEDSPYTKNLGVDDSTESKNSRFSPKKLHNPKVSQSESDFAIE